MGKKVDINFIKRAVTDWGKVLLLLLDEAAVVVLVILALRFFEVQIPLPIAIATAVVVGGLVLVIHVAVIPSFRRKPVTGQEGMMGLQGRVTEPLNPLGTIIVKGEYWKARTLDDNMKVDENVEIAGMDGLTLKVKRVGR